MPLLFWILIFSSVGSMFSLIGGILLLLRADWIQRNTLNLVSWAAGILLSVAFLDLFPEAVELAVEMDLGPQLIFVAALGAMLLFFIMERTFLWFHHHHEPDMKMPSAIMMMSGDTVHNLLDGIVIATAFLVSVPTGIVTAIAVAAHEIPQEIADFALLARAGIKRRRILAINLLSALATPLGAALGFYFGAQIESFEPLLLGFAAGMFTYIATSDLIPELHHANSRKIAGKQMLFFLAGILTTVLFVLFLEI